MDRTPNADKPLKDHGSFSRSKLSEDDINAHHREHWQDQAMYIGLRYPKDRKKRHHRKHGPRPPKDESSAKDKEPSRPPTPPSQRVQFLLGREELEEDEDRQAHEMFCEMEELRAIGDDGEKEWKETARWIKFEEDVEEGGERWSKPHVATLSLHSLFELRKSIMTGTVMLDTEATNMAQVSELVLDHMVASKQLEEECREAVQDALLSRHRHQHQKKESKGLPMIRSLADIGRKASEKRIEGMRENVMKANQSSGFLVSGSAKPSAKDLPGDVPRNQSSADVTDPSTHKTQYNEHFLKKIPAGAEATNVLVGEVDSLTHEVMAFVRLQKAVMLPDLTEVAVPTRFIFALLGPPGNQQKYHEIGRSIGTLMSDEIFHDVAYKARDRNDLLSGIDEFLDCVTVLPPGEWDPTIRIEPPKSVPSQEKRKKPEPPKTLPPNGSAIVEPEVVEEEHGDPSLARTGRIFGGLIADIKRKVPFFLSDFKDALHVQCVASFFFMYFACLSPIITFGGLLGAATGENIAAMESLVSGAICGISYHLFAGQPLTIIGSTGPVLVFETIVYNFCMKMAINYLAFRFWIGMWVCLILLLMVAFDLSALVRYITRFTEESFAMLIALIFIYEAFKKLIHILDKSPVDLHPDLPQDFNCSCFPPPIDPDNSSSAASFLSTTLSSVTGFANSTDAGAVDWSAISDKKTCADYGGVAFGSGCDTVKWVPDVFFLSCLLFGGTFILALCLKNIRNMRFFPNQARIIISDFAVVTAIFVMVLTDFLINLNTPKLKVPPEFRPTLEGRGWIVNPFRNDWFWIFAGLPPALLATILIFMDQQITSVIVNRKENKLLKGSGYHLDLLVITIQIAICSLLGTPWFVAATVLSINHIRSLTRESESSAPGERPKFLGVREQRVTGILVFIMVGLSALMADVLKYIPMPVLYGVFLFMGVSSLKGIQFVQRVMIMFMPTKYQPDYMFLRNVPLRRVHLFTAIQIFCLVGLWVIKQIEMISIVFPLMVLAMCFIRKALDWVFTRHELKWLDDIMPESHKREKEEKRKKLIDEDNPEEQVIEMEGGVVNIPLKEGKSLQIPVNRITYDPVSHQMNISEEMSKTGIWHQLNSESQLQQPRHRKVKDTTIEEEEESSPRAKPEEVRFQIADEDEDEQTDANESLIKKPNIVINPPPYSSAQAMSKV